MDGDSLGMVEALLAGPPSQERKRLGRAPKHKDPCPCGKPAKVKGLCIQHYHVARRARRGRPVDFLPVRSSRDTLRDRHRAKQAMAKPSLRLNLLTRRNTAAELRHWREWWASPESGRDPMPHPEEECAEAPCGWLTARMPGNDWREVYEDEVHRHANRPRSSSWCVNHDWHGIADLDGSGWTFWPRDDGERGW